MASLVDTNVLVYRFDPRDPVKQRIAADLLRAGLARWRRAASMAADSTRPCSID